MKKLKNNKPKYDLEHLDGFKLTIDNKFNERKAELKEKMWRKYGEISKI